MDGVSAGTVWYSHTTPTGEFVRYSTPIRQDVFRTVYAPIETAVDNNNAQIAACESYLSAFSETKNRILLVWQDVTIKVTEGLYQYEAVRPWVTQIYAVGMGRTPKEAWDDVLRNPQFIRDEAIFLSGKAAGVAETYAAFSKGFLTQEQRRRLEELHAIAAANFANNYPITAYRGLDNAVSALLEETKCPLQLLNTLSREEVESLTKPPKFPESTCVECGREMPAGQLQKCAETECGFCCWRKPRALGEWVESLTGGNR